MGKVFTFSYYFSHSQNQKSTIELGFWIEILIFWVGKVFTFSFYSSHSKNQKSTMNTGFWIEILIFWVGKVFTNKFYFSHSKNQKWVHRYLLWIHQLKFLIFRVLLVLIILFDAKFTFLLACTEFRSDTKLSFLYQNFVFQKTTQIFFNFI